MKKIRRNIIIIILLVIIALYFFLTKRQGTIPKTLKDFAIEDTATVDKIFMVNKENQQVLLERKGNTWMVNGKYYVRKDAINTLLKTIHRIDVKAPVAKSMFKNVVSTLAAKSTKIEIYQKGKLKKTYYVGGATKDQYGTYMLLEGSSQPFIMHIKGFKGFLTPRYFISESQWRDRILFQYNFSEIASVDVQQPMNPEASFTIYNLGDNSFELKTTNEQKTIDYFDTLKVKTYLASYKKIYFDSFINYMEIEKKDSILNTSPHFVITVKDTEGKTNKITTYYKPNDGLIDDSGNLLKFNPDYEYALIGNDEEMVLIQYYVFNPLFKELDYFRLNGSNR